MILTQKQAALILNGISSIGPVTVKKLRKFFDNDLAAAVNAPFQTLLDAGIGKVMAERICSRERIFDFKKEEEKIAALKAVFIDFDDERYPQSLREHPETAPIGLYLRGNPDVLKSAETHSVSFVGTRKSTLYGNNQATHFAEEIAARGWTIVSGFADGIDRASHLGALNARGNTLAVLGTGINVCYPSKNSDIFDAILNGGGAVVSEFVIDRKADRQTFPQRNRIVAAVSKGTFVVESDIKGGSMITVNFALNCNKKIFALPGRIDVPASAGCHKLIREGATLVTCPDDILYELDGFGPAGTPVFDFVENTEIRVNQKRQKAAEISPDAGRVFELLADGEKLTLDELIEKSGLDMPRTAAATMLLELEQIIVKYADGRYEIN